MRKAVRQAHHQGNRRRGRGRSRRRPARRRLRPASAFSITCSISWRGIRASTSTVKAKGDLHIDHHHTTEDVGIALGQAVKQALGDMKGITRYADVHVPMDEALTRVAIDISGRPFLVFKVEFVRAKVGTFDTELVQEWFQAFAMNAGSDAARRDSVRQQRPSYRRILLQGSGAGAAGGGGHRSAGRQRGAVDQGHAGRLMRTCGEPVRRSDHARGNSSVLK